MHTSLASCQISLPAALAGIKVGVSGLFGARLRLLNEFSFQQKKKRQAWLEIHSCMYVFKKYLFITAKLILGSWMGRAILWLVTSGTY